MYKLDELSMTLYIAETKEYFTYLHIITKNSKLEIIKDLKKHEKPDIKGISPEDYVAKVTSVLDEKLLYTTKILTPDRVKFSDRDKSYAIIYDYEEIYFDLNQFSVNNPEYY